jgi:hypothetical protein
MQGRVRRQKLEKRKPGKLFWGNFAEKGGEAN